MRRAALLICTLVVLLGSGVAVAAVVSDDEPVAAASVERAHKYWRAGPSAEYGSDFGSIGEVEPLRLVVPEGAWDVVVEVSAQYRTRGRGTTVLYVGMGQVDDGPEVRTRPGEVVLAPAPEGDAGTARFLAEGVAGGATYEVRPWVNSSFGGADIWTRKVLVTVELTPVAD